MNRLIVSMYRSFLFLIQWWKGEIKERKKEEFARRFTQVSPIICLDPRMLGERQPMTEHFEFNPQLYCLQHRPKGAEGEYLFDGHRLGVSQARLEARRIINLPLEHHITVRDVVLFLSRYNLCCEFSCKSIVKISISYPRVKWSSTPPFFFNGLQSYSVNSTHDIDDAAVCALVGFFRSSDTDKMEEVGRSDEAVCEPPPEIPMSDPDSPGLPLTVHGARFDLWKRLEGETRKEFDRRVRVGRRKQRVKKALGLLSPVARFVFWFFVSVLLVNLFLYLFFLALK